MVWIVVIIAMAMGVGTVAIIMEAAKEMQRRRLSHRERMKELDLEHLRLKALLSDRSGADELRLVTGDPAIYLPDPSDTLVRRGPSNQ